MVIRDRKKGTLKHYPTTQSESGADVKMAPIESAIEVSLYQTTKTLLVDGITHVQTFYTALTNRRDVVFGDEIVLDDKVYRVSEPNQDGRLTSLVLELKQ